MLEKFGIIMVVWLIDDEDEFGAGMPSPSLDQIRWLYAVAGGASTSSTAEQPRRLPDHLARIPVGVGPIGRIATTRQPFRVIDLDKEPGELSAEREWFHVEIRGFVGAPIVYKDEVLGVLAGFTPLIASDEATRWGRVFADHVAGAIANARAFEEIQRLKAQLEQQNEYLREEVVEAKAFGDLVGQSAALGQVVSQIDLVAPTDASVIILGETGTGKELVAHEIHRRSRRQDKPLVRVNCASIPKDLYESEFFGHAKGAFTGAIKDRAGRFETAEGGTLFLDEIAEVPLELQSKLLRVLQEKRYERVGEDRTRRADVRIIAATNRDLKKETEAGRFREDLYYRLNVFPIHVAPLRERKEDVPLLSQHFVQRSIHELRCQKPRLTRAGTRYRLKGHRRFIRLAPLPSRAQFLNVIESVFSGLHASIIQNSDYESVDEAKAAIDRYFLERNEYFRKHPKRAGEKIWGRERVPPAFQEGQNCRNPRYR
jgi:transcriptional regulator with GAF, ATPase, and Fis domain